MEALLDMSIENLLKNKPRGRDGGFVEKLLEERRVRVGVIVRNASNIVQEDVGIKSY